MTVKERDEILVIEENIPEELKVLPYFVLWKYVQKFDTEGNPKKPTKIPFQPNGKLAESDNEQTWSTFEQVIHTLKNSCEFQGIGFMFKAPYVGFDTDNSIDINTGEIDPTAMAMIKRLKSYTELSPSKKGFHIIVKVTKPLPINRYKKKGNYECYEEKRFFTFTGQVFKGLNKISVRDEEAEQVVNEVFLKPKKEYQGTVYNIFPIGERLTKERVLEVMGRGKNTRRIQQFIDGQWQQAGNYPSQSEADAAFLNDLAFYTQKDAQMMNEIFCESGMYRPEKWHRSQSGTTFGVLEIQNAIANCTNTYMPSKTKGDTYFQRLPQEFLDDNTTIKDIQTNKIFEPMEKQDKKQLITQITAVLEQNPSNGKVLNNARNANKILSSPIFKDTLGYDLFRQREVILKNLPWRNRYESNLPYENWMPDDDFRLMNWMDTYFNLNKQATVKNALVERMYTNAFHPVKDFIESTIWDGTERVEKFFIEWLGASDTPYVRSVTRKWLVAAVTRIYRPGCKFDYMPILVGEQGVGKSSTINKLAGEWFNDSLNSFDSKEAGELLQSGWIFEIAELSAMKKAEEEEIKKFLSKTVDSYRPAYARVVVDNKRHCVFIGTTNTHGFLKDSTGNRRFLPISVSTNRRYNPFIDLTEVIVKQIWAEAYQYYLKGETIDLEDEIKEIAKLAQAEHIEMDPRSGKIESYLEMLLPSNWDDLTKYERKSYFFEYQNNKLTQLGTQKRERVCAQEVWCECLGNDENDLSTHEARKISATLRLLDWKQRKPNRTRFKIYGTQTTFIKE